MNQAIDAEHIKRLWSMDFEDFQRQFADVLLTEDDKALALRIAHVDVLGPKNPLVDELLKREEGFRKEESIFGGRIAIAYVKTKLQLLSDRVMGAREQIHGAVCIRFDYCKKRKEGVFEGEGYQLCTAVAEALVVLETSLGMPVVSLSVYLVKKRLLDKWCAC